MTRLFAILYFLPWAPLAIASPPKPVRISFVEALSPKDTTSSLRFQKEFEGAISTGVGALSQKAKACGYTLETATAFFDSTDPLQAKEAAEKAVTAGSWLIVGPRRSNHYILLAKGGGQTPTVSLMASASEIRDLGPRHVSLSPQNSDMAKTAAIEAKKRTKKNGKYVSVVSEDCLSCVDFNSSFANEANKIGLKSIGEFKIKGETPDLASIAETVGQLKPDFVLIPNFSKVTAQIIASISVKLKKTIFVGSDGWGDSNFGFLQDDAGVLSANGFTVRGFPPVAEALKTFDLGKSLLKKNAELPTSGPGVAILKSLEGVVQVLCASKPASKIDFASAFEKHSRQFSAPFGVSIYDLERANIVFRSKVVRR